MSEHSNARGALFDLDGVLIDSEGIYTEFWEQIDHDFPTGIPGFAQVIKGSTLEKILDKNFKDADKPEILRRLDEQEHNMVYRLFPGVPELLMKLHDADWKIAIVTSSNPSKMESLFKQQPILKEYTDVLITDSDVTRSKPDPEGYLLAAHRLGCSPCDCLVFEDSINGLKAGRAAGARVIGICTTNPAEAVSAIADVTLSAIADFNLATMA